MVYAFIYVIYAFLGDCQVSVEGYDIYRHDRDTSGGGVAVYIKDTLSHHKREDIRDPNLEIIGIEITPKNAMLSTYPHGSDPGELSTVAIAQIRAFHTTEHGWDTI